MTVRRLAMAWGMAGALALAVPAVGVAQATSKPANATGECKDGTFTSAASKRGACSGHGGVTTWYADAKSGTKAAAKETKSAAKTAEKDTKSAAKTAEKDTTAATKTVEKDTKAASKTAAKDTKAAAKDTANETKSAAKETKNAAKEATATSPRPSDAPPDATAQCNDGTYSKAVHHQGACSGHKGVKTWYK